MTMNAAAKRPKKRMLLRIAILVLVPATWAVITPTGGFAQTAERNAESPAFKACMKKSGGITASMRACLHAEYTRLDRELNITYKSVMKQLKTKDQKTRLVNSQRVWIWRRDEQCQRRVDESGAKGGTAGDLIYDDCRVTMVRERINWLKKVPSNPGYLSKV
jgi:uncharacterized protein YecT (DUF1311 family)